MALIRTSAFYHCSCPQLLWLCSNAACTTIGVSCRSIHRYSIPSANMETESCDAVHPRPQVKATLRLGTGSYSVQANKGSLSEQLVSLKEQSMIILKDFITKHNVPHDVPDELLEASSEDDEIPEKPQVKSKKTKLT